MHAFMISVQTAIYRASIIFDIPFVMFAEEGGQNMEVQLD